MGVLRKIGIIAIIYAFAAFAVNVGALDNVLPDLLTSNTLTWFWNPLTHFAAPSLGGNIPIIGGAIQSAIAAIIALIWSAICLIIGLIFTLKG